MTRLCRLPRPSCPCQKDQNPQRSGAVGLGCLPSQLCNVANSLTFILGSLDTNTSWRMQADESKFIYLILFDRFLIHTVPTISRIIKAALKLLWSWHKVNKFDPDSSKSLFKNEIFLITYSVSVLLLFPNFIADKSKSAWRMISVEF